MENNHFLMALENNN